MVKISERYFGSKQKYFVHGGVRPDFKVRFDIAAYSKETQENLELVNNVLIEHAIGFNIFSRYLNERSIRVEILDPEEYSDRHSNMIYRSDDLMVKRGAVLPAAIYSLESDQVDILPELFFGNSVRFQQAMSETSSALLNAFSREDIPSFKVLKWIRCGIAFFTAQEIEKELKIGSKVNYCLNQGFTEFLSIKAGMLMPINEHYFATSSVFDIERAFGFELICRAYFFGEIDRLEAVLTKNAFRNMSKNADLSMAMLLNATLASKDPSGKFIPQ